jgi:hypothetical protein
VSHDGRIRSIALLIGSCGRGGEVLHLLEIAHAGRTKNGHPIAEAAVFLIGSTLLAMWNRDDP